MLYEDQFKVFYEVPIYELTRVEKELRLSMDIDGIVPVDPKMPWPEVEFLFGEDEEYQDIIAEIMRNVTISISNVTNAADVKTKHLLINFTKICFNFHFYDSSLTENTVIWLLQHSS